MSNARGRCALVRPTARAFGRAAIRARGALGLRALTEATDSRIIIDTPSRPMTDPFPTAPAPPPHDADGDRAARIEALLVAGLDHYFAAQYEQAINVWTRVAFLDRHDDRARAYIERARTALAERQRQSDELLHRGRAAYRDGDLSEARDLLTRARSLGAVDAAALRLLDRLDQAQGTGFDLPSAPSLPPAALPVTLPGTVPASGWRRRGATARVAAFVLALVVAVGGWWAWTSWMSRSSLPVVAATAEPLPTVRRADVLIDTAQTLYVSGHLHDALRALDRAGNAPVRRDEVLRLRARKIGRAHV